MDERIILQAWSDNAALNRAICEGAAKRELIAFSEALFRVAPSTVRQLTAEEAKRWRKEAKITEAAESVTALLLYEAKVFHVDKKNANDRIYPRQVMQDNIDRLKPLMKDGYLIGAMDHLGYFEGGNLGKTCVKWMDLTIEADGSGMAKFEVVPTKAGEDLQAMLDSKVAVGFSTYGYGTGHEPGDAERQEYGLGDEEYCVVMDRNYVLKKIDAVDDPSVGDARVKQGENAGGNTREKTGDNPRASIHEENSGDPANATGATARAGASKETPTMDPIKTLADLEAKFPEVFRQHQEAIAAAKRPLEAEVTGLKDRVKKLTDAVNPILKGLANVEGVELPRHEVLPAEMGQRVTALETAKGEADRAKGEAERKLAEAEQKAKDLEAKEANRLRVGKIVTKARESLKDNDYRDMIVDDLKEKLNDPSFTEEKLDAFIDARAERYHKMMGNRRPAERQQERQERKPRPGDRNRGGRGEGPREGAGRGRGVEDDELDALEESCAGNDGGDDERDDIEPAAELAFGPKVRERNGGGNRGNGRRNRDADEDDE